MLENEYYSQEVHGPFEYFDLGDFPLERGGTLRDCRLAYATFGKLSPKKDNAILFTIMYSGTNKHMEHYIGEGRALDPSKYFIILPNQLGSGLSTSPHNTPPPYGMGAFPELTLGDDVAAQYRLLAEEFGIKSLELVLGWSMGAQQTYEWAVRHPEMVRRAAPIGGTAKTTPHDALFVDVFSEALRSDPAWNGGFYTEPHAVHLGLRRQARVFALMGLTPDFYKRELWRQVVLGAKSESLIGLISDSFAQEKSRRVGFSSMEDFLVGFWENWFVPMDPNNLLAMAAKWKRGDVSLQTGGDLAKALGRIQAKVFVMPFKEDMFIRLEDCRAEQKLIPGSELRPIPTPWGHFGMMGLFARDFHFIDKSLKELLDTPA